jgi:hypothetical protein
MIVTKIKTKNEKNNYNNNKRGNKKIKKTMIVTNGRKKIKIEYIVYFY